MSNDWIKMRVGLQNGDPHVVRILSAMCTQPCVQFADKCRVVGALHAVWCIFDQYSQDGKVAYTPAEMDTVVGWSGFTQAMIDEGWLEFDGANTLIMNNPESHNGKPAKRRASENKRIAELRAQRTQDVRIDAYKKRTRGRGDIRSKSKSKAIQGGRVLEAPPPSRFTQADFDQRDLRLIGVARKKLTAWIESHPSSSRDITNSEVYSRIADETGLTIERILALEKLQHQWPQETKSDTA